MSVLSPREGYRLWAGHYETETVVSWLDELCVRELGVPTVGRRVLDVGCGTARRLRASGAAPGVGVDVTPEMLARDDTGQLLAAGDVRALPVRPMAFDVVWCRLVIGHVADLEAAYGELTRVCARLGAVIVTDFHPAAVEAGHRRTFRAGDGTVHELEHHAHSFRAHMRAAHQARLAPLAQCDGVVDERVRHLYERSGRLHAYRAQEGLPLVMALAFGKVA